MQLLQQYTISRRKNYRVQSDAIGMVGMEIDHMANALYSSIICEFFIADALLDYNIFLINDLIT